jgi:hypothetical protein
MYKLDCRVGMRVRFGHSGGEQTLGTIVKLNPTKAKIQSDEPRRGFKAGTIWGVPYDIINSAEGADKTKEKLTYDPSNKIQNLIVEAIMLCQAGLEPDSMLDSKDRAILRRQLNGLNLAFGRELDITEIIDWTIAKSFKENKSA